MRTLILAAGFGTRMQPLTTHLPKALVPVCGVPLLQRKLEFCKEQGLGPVMVNSHYLHPLMVDFQTQSSVAFDISWEQEAIRGSGGGIYHARRFLGQDEIFCVANAEPLTNFALQPLIEQFVHSDALCALVCAPAATRPTIFCRPHDHEYLGTTADDLSAHDTLGLCFIGVALYRRAFLDYLDESTFAVQPLWRRVQEDGHAVRLLLSTPKYWYDIGNPAELAAIHFDYCTGAVQWPVPPHVHTDGGGRRVYPHALDNSQVDRVGPLSWLESDLPPGCTLEHCVVLAGSTLEAGRGYHHCLVTPWGVVDLAS